VETEVRSRDIGSTLSSAVKRKSKKSEKAATRLSSSTASQTTTATTETSSGINFKFIMGVAIVSIVIGVILGKRY